MIINTIAPIPIDELKKYFSDNTISYVIDYQNSTLKGKKLLTYLSNLDLPCDIAFASNEDKEEMLVEYLHSPFIVTVPSLETAVIDILLEYKALEDNGYDSFIAKNIDIIKHWTKVLDSLALYNMFTIEADEFKDWAKSFPVNKTDSSEGINFVSLLKHEDFYAFYSIVNRSDIEFYETYFTTSMFKGKNLFKYWANENNPMFLLTYGIATGAVAEELQIN